MNATRLCGCFIVLGLVSAAARADAGRRYDYQEKTLENGLRVITLEDHSCPIVAVQVWYHVGSKDEAPERQGFAHMFEHMMFRGTDRLGPEEHFKYIRRTGGDCNAFTSFDNTTYVNKLPSNQLELALWLEAERMAFLKVDQEGFSTERKVVEEERRLGLNSPYGTVPERLLPVLFKQHPYRWTPIGQIPHLRAASVEEVGAFWDKFYLPNNAVLVIVGDIRHASAQAAAQKYFAWIPRSPALPRVTEKEPAQTEARQATIKEDKGPIPVVGMVYRAVPKGHPDTEALEMLMRVLGGGESSRLYRDLVKERQLCQMAMAATFALEDDGLMGAGAAIMPWKNRDQILGEIAKHLQKLIDEPITERELTKVKNQLSREVVTGALTVENKANLLGEAALLEGDPDRVNQRLARIQAVTADDIQRVAKTYLVPERRTEIRIEPSLGSMLGSLLGFGKGPAEDEGATAATEPAGENHVAPRTGVKASAVRPDGFPNSPPVQSLLEDIPSVAHTSRTLENKLPVTVMPNHEVPFVTITLGLKYGAWAEDPAMAGVASMTLSMLTQGTQRHSAVELAEEIEYNALTLSGHAGLDTSMVEATCLSDKIDVALQLLAEVVLQPTFPKDEFEILRQQTVMGLMIESEEPSYLADRELRRRLYGTHPYARTSTGELEDVRRIRPEALAAWWKTFARPDAAALYIAGDVTPDAVFALVERHLGSWVGTGPNPQPALPEIPASGATHIYVVDKPNSVQSQIRVGHLGITLAHPLYHQAALFDQIFGGAFDSRLNKAVRIEKGLTYGAHGGFSARRFAGEFGAGTFSKTPQTAEAVSVLMNVVRGMATTAATAEEMDVSRSYLVGSFAGDRETPDATVHDLWLIESCGLPQDYFQAALRAYKQTQPEDITRIATTLVKPDAMTIVVVGDAAKISTDLEKIAPVTVVSPDPPPTTREAASSQPDARG